MNVSGKVKPEKRTETAMTIDILDDEIVYILKSK